jgi:hypothetical protein
VGAALLLVATLAVAGCNQNPILGEWEIDPAENQRGAILAAEATRLTALTFRPKAIAAEDTVIAVAYVLEERRVRAVREDGRGEHLIELLREEKIRVELPIGVTVVYRKSGS